ncbi:MAG: tyrosine-type recombinase/integrase [Bacteroidetes bacterium]|nr:tyrosine-type recombinase/integrase [Bacteroidota bacterium]
MNEKDDILQDFTVYLRGEGYRRQTVCGNMGMIRRFLCWVSDENMDYTEITYRDVLSYIDHLKEKGNQKSTINQCLGAIRHFYNCLQSAGLVSCNPAETLRIRNITRRVPHDLLTWDELENLYHSYPEAGVTGKRNKAVIGLAVYQGLNASELAAIELTDVKLEEGKIYVPVTGRSNSRTLKLEAFQVLQLQKYITQVRPVILIIAEKESEKLFISTGKGDRISNSYVYMLRVVTKLNPKVKDMKQIRASVITRWMSLYHIRQVQYMAGHRYISSTEYYRTDQIEGLQDQIDELHPLQ